ncbi:MAG: ATP-dependent Clp protease adaptor ClpS [Salibacteraceae bacterium]
MVFSHQTEELEEVLVDEESSNAIILYNDDVNTFDHVIDSLIEVCRHSSTQAEQVAWIVHTKGKCDVKHGSFERLHPLCKKLQSRGLSAVIEN